MIVTLLPEEDAIDDPDDDDEADSSLPGDLWYRFRLPAVKSGLATRRGA